MGKFLVIISGMVSLWAQHEILSAKKEKGKRRERGKRQMPGVGLGHKSEEAVTVEFSAHHFFTAVK